MNKHETLLNWASQRAVERSMLLAAARARTRARDRKIIFACLSATVLAATLVLLWVR